MSVQTFLLPDVGEGLTEAEILSWNIAVGDTVTVNQLIVDIETVKSVVELPSPYAGEVLELLATEGETVPVGTPIITIRTTADTPAKPEPEPEPQRAPEPEPEPAPAPEAQPVPEARPKLLVGYGAPDAGRTPRRRTRPATTSPAEQRIPIKGVRKHTAAAMVASAFSAPHVTEFVSVDLTKTLELRELVQRRREFRDTKLTPLAFIARAYLRAIARTPMANARWDEAAQEIVVPAEVNLGIAAATPRGLIVPNIKAAHTLGLLDLAGSINDLAGTARAGKTTPEAMAGGTTTITNVGVFGVDTGTPILNPGETAILAVGAIRRRAWVVEDAAGERIEPRSVLTLALSFDHRVMDGQEGSQLLADTAALLTEPGLAML